MINFQMTYFFRLFFVLLLLSGLTANAQRIGVGRQSTPTAPTSLVDYNNPKEYIIGGITVVGVQYLDKNTLISVAGLNVNEKITIPGERITTAIRRLMDQGILEDVSINITSIEDNKVFLELDLRERPRLNKIVLNGIRNGQKETIEEKIKTYKGKVITEAMVKNMQNIIKKHYLDKGFLHTKVQAQQINDTIRTSTAQIVFNIDRGKKARIDKIEIEGLNEVPKWRALSKMKGTKEKAPLRIFNPSKFREKKYKEDKEKLIAFLNKNGYRNANIDKDSVYINPNGNVGIKLEVTEGQRFYYRNITWVGNYVRNTDTLNLILGIEKGDVYNPEDLQKRLNGKPTGGDVSSYYQDDGYLYFNVEPVEVAVVGDSIDIELRIREGKQATISKIILNGNTKTSDHVVLREILTKPGQKFSRSDLVETVQSLTRLGYFDPQKIDPKPVPQADGTVNIEYTVEEKSSDNIELSGGYSAMQGIIGTFGVVFNNFSIRKIFDFKEYKPLPKGDGQKFSIRLQANGGFQNYSLSFSEPWLGGKKPNSLTVSLWHSVQDLGKMYDRYRRYYANSAYADYYNTLYSSAYYNGYFKNTGLSVGFGKRLNWPDRNFNFSSSLSYQFYDVKDSWYLRGFSNGVAHDLSLGFNLSRYSLDNPQFTRTGSNVSLSGTFNPPYSGLGIEPKNNRMFIEGHKWMFDLDWYTPVVGKFIFHAKANMGFLGRYNSKNDYSPFGRFVLGGAGMGMQNSNSIGIELIGLRGYEEGIVYEPTYNEAADVLNQSAYTRQGGIIYNKYAVELRYPVSLNAQATIYLLTFAEAGNSWGSYKDFNPFKIRRSAGVGARVFMAAFGLLGIDYGYAFDPIPGLPNQGKKAFTFSIGQQIR
jgi:outer membrane protein insertion porin family